MGLKYQCFSDKLYDVIDTDQELQTVCSGFTFIEGPIWNSNTQTLTFNDIPESKTYRYQAETGVQLIRTDTHKANGNAYDDKENIIVCEHVRSCISKTDRDGKNVEVLVSKYLGKELNSPNDVIVSRSGMIYFTDPIFGRNPSRVGLGRKQELSFQGVYRFDPVTKELILLADDFENPNGLCFSLNEKYLFIDDSPRKHIRRFEVGADGNLYGGEVFAQTTGEGVGLPDGLKIDRDENLYCCAQGGVHVFDKKANYLGIIMIPEQVGNCAFGGARMDTLYLTASTAVYSFKIKGNAKNVIEAGRE